MLHEHWTDICDSHSHNAYFCYNGHSQHWTMVTTATVITTLPIVTYAHWIEDDLVTRGTNVVIVGFLLKLSGYEAGQRDLVDFSNSHNGHNSHSDHNTPNCYI